MHLENCPACTDRFEFESGMKRLVRTCCGSQRAPERLRERLREILSN